MTFEQLPLIEKLRIYRQQKGARFVVDWLYRKLEQVKENWHLLGKFQILLTELHRVFPGLADVLEDVGKQAAFHVHVTLQRLQLVEIAYNFAVN